MAKYDFYSIPMLAKELGLSRMAVFKQVKNGKIKTLRMGTTYLIPSGEADRLIKGSDRKTLKKAVKRVFREYGDVIRQLGNK